MPSNAALQRGRASTMTVYAASTAPAVPAAARRLELADLPWAADLLARASAGHPALSYVCGPDERAHCWLLHHLARYVVQYGCAYANAAGTAVALWLGPDGNRTWHLRLHLLPAVGWRLGWGNARRLWQLCRTQAWLQAQSVQGPHHVLLGLAVQPASRGRGEGRRLLAATLALRQATGLPCYLGTQQPAQMPFYQRQGFVLAGHCPVGAGPAGHLSTWALLLGSPPP